MWCTRWFIPLLFLPLPTAPPFFLVLFLLSLTLHAKPCFYCIVLLTTLFISSCYWQPFPLDTPLASPWSENITTFAEALNATLSPNYTQPLPTVIRAVDRCWCDLSSNSFFEPFNISKWEHASVLHLKEELERRQRMVKENVSSISSAINASTTFAELDSQMPRTAEPKPSSPPLHVAPSQSFAFRLSQISLHSFRDLLPKRLPHRSPEVSAPLTSLPSQESQAPERNPAVDLPLSPLRREYDLRPYGLNLVVDFGWSRP